MDIRITKPSNPHAFTVHAVGHDEQESLQLACAMMDDQGYVNGHVLEVINVPGS